MHGPAAGPRESQQSIACVPTPSSVTVVTAGNVVVGNLTTKACSQVSNHNKTSGTQLGVTSSTSLPVLAPENSINSASGNLATPPVTTVSRALSRPSVSQVASCITASGKRSA